MFFCLRAVVFTGHYLVNRFNDYMGCDFFLWSKLFDGMYMSSNLFLFEVLWFNWSIF